MRRLSFLTGTWSGEARMLRGPGAMAEMLQTEEVQFRLDGLVLTIEGNGRRKADGAPALQALGIISYDDEHAVYRMRAFNDGRWLETDVQLAEDGRGMRWGFVLGEIRTSSALRINEDGEWTEHAEIMIGGQAPRTLLELAVRRRSD